MSKVPVSLVWVDADQMFTLSYAKEDAAKQENGLLLLWRNFLCSRN
jgi:hypothetical protein